MRKLILLTTAATLCGLAASAQEVSSAPENGVEVSAVARFDVNPYFPLTSGSEMDLSFGNTSIYTFIDGTFGRGWSYSVSNHWMGVSWYMNAPEEKMAPLYSNSFRSNSTDWIDWATISYDLDAGNAGVWTFTVGKDMMALGLSEFEANDVDMHYDLSSFFWNGAPIEMEEDTWFAEGMQVYQWGGSIGWTSPSEGTNLRFQMSSSPYAVWPYKDAKMAFALQLNEFQGPWTGRFSVNAVGDYLDYDADGSPYGSSWWRYFSLGQSLAFGELTIDLDAMMRGRTWKTPFEETLATLKLQYDFGEKASLFAKGGWEMFGYNPDEPGYRLDAFWGGIGAHWFPLRDSQALRVHTIVAANSPYKQLSVNVGITYNLCISDFWNK